MATVNEKPGGSGGLMFRFKRYDEALLTESLARFGWEKIVCLPIEKVRPRADGDAACEAVASQPRRPAETSRRLTKGDETLIDPTA